VTREVNNNNNNYYYVTLSLTETELEQFDIAWQSCTLRSDDCQWRSYM